MHENSREGLQQPAQMSCQLDKVKAMIQTTVHRVMFSEADNTATGVVLTDGRKITARKEVIICAGTYHTPQLLQLSGIGP
jgi:choline dehydrogenase-like flavoprotein